MARRWGVEPEVARSARPSPRPFNLGQVLDLGSTVYFSFRGRQYGVPPLPWRLGERMLVARTVAKEAAEAWVEDSNRSTLASYYESLEDVQTLLWEAIRPCGRIHRLMKRFHVARNPFRDVTERELVDLLDFVLGLRMRSEITRDPVPVALRDVISSMTSSRSRGGSRRGAVTTGSRSPIDTTSTRRGDSGGTTREKTSGEQHRTEQRERPRSRTNAGSKR